MGHKSSKICFQGAGPVQGHAIESPLFLSAFWRTLLVAVLTVLGQTAIAILNAYVFAKVPFRGREKVFVVLLLAMLMPFQMTVLPTYLMVRRLGYSIPGALIVPCCLRRCGLSCCARP